MSGRTCFAGTRGSAGTLFNVLEGGEPLSEILRGWPTVEREQAIGVLQMAKEQLTSVPSEPGAKTKTTAA